MSDIEKIFIENIKHYRAIKNISQGELAERTGIGQGRLSRIENGKVEPGLFTIEKIAEGLEVSASELLMDVSGKNSSFQERVKLIETLSEYDQKLVDALLESFLEKARLTNFNKVNIKNRLAELKRIKEIG